jgi:hypothetical protein
MWVKSSIAYFQPYIGEHCWGISSAMRQARSFMKLSAWPLEQIPYFQRDFP